MTEETGAVVNLDLRDVQAHDSVLGELIHEMMGRDLDKTGQMIPELNAGRQYLRALKVRRDIIEELLVRPLRELERASSERIRPLAGEYLAWLLKSLQN